MFKRFVYWTLNIDTKVMDSFSSTKERNLAYSSFIRLLASTLFVFGVTLFACSHVPSLQGVKAWILAFLISAIIFWFDSAIIGAEWEISQNYEKKSIFGGVLHFFKKLVRLAPRIIFSVAIAYTVAIIAELAVQKNAITQVLDREIQQYNKDSGHTERRIQLIASHKEAESTLRTEIANLDTLIESKGSRSFNERLNALESTHSATSKIITAASEDVKNLRILKKDLENTLRELSQTENTLKQQIASQSDLREQELSDPNKCNNPGSDGCKGDRYWELNRSIIAAERELSNISPQIAAINNRIKQTQTDISSRSVELSQANDELQNFDSQLTEIDNNHKSLEDLEKEREDKNNELGNLIESNKNELVKFDQSESLLGLSQRAQYDFLQLYGGLKILHTVPENATKIEKEAAIGAKRFSIGLFIFIILMELSAVITALFFTPYSEYAAKMYVKRKKAQLNQHLEESKMLDVRESLRETTTENPEHKNISTLHTTKLEQIN